MKDFPLNDTWVLWFHSITETSFSNNTYRKVAEVSTIKEFYELFNCFETFNKGMFYLMRKGIFPKWEDTKNIKGGYFSYKISKQISEKVFRELCCSCIGECLTKKFENMKTINGVSYSPKINNTIIKILNNDASMGDKRLLSDNIEHLHPNTSRFKPHMENSEVFVFE